MGLIINGSLEVMVISKSGRRKGVQWYAPTKQVRETEVLNPAIKLYNVWVSPK
jgi:hypothetical protein